MTYALVVGRASLPASRFTAFRTTARQEPRPPDELICGKTAPPTPEILTKIKQLQQQYGIIGMKLQTLKTA
jgi:hypothetical protein